MKNKFITSLVIIISIFTLFVVSNKVFIENIEADSGFDTDYDSGGGGNGFDTDFGDNSISGSIFSGFKNFFVTIVFVIILISLASNKNSKSHQVSTIEKYNELSSDYVNNIINDFNIDDFKSFAYKTFFDVQMAWMEFDYDKLKELLTDELYNNYCTNLESLKLKGQKNVMKGFDLSNIKLTGLKEENNLYIATIVLNVKFYDYISDEKGNLLRGSDSRKVNNTYKLTFIRSKDKEKDIINCPRCGAPVLGNATGICEYCGSKLINDAYDWVLSKKEIISQR